jgi:3-hydroxyisobutyrate dehydrogenase-like beta-hydroxyacid dehydrogenase
MGRMGRDSVYVGENGTGQAMYCTYNVILRSVCATIIAAKKKQ